MPAFNPSSVWFPASWMQISIVADPAFPMFDCHRSRETLCGPLRRVYRPTIVLRKEETGVDDDFVVCTCFYDRFTVALSLLDDVGSCDFWEICDEEDFWLFRCFGEMAIFGRIFWGYYKMVVCTPGKCGSTCVSLIVNNYCSYIRETIPWFCV